MVRRVAVDVNAETGGRQRPEIISNLLDDYYLNARIAPNDGR
jgi:hypothetical protein